MRTGSAWFGKWHRIIFSERNFAFCVSSCAQFGNDFRGNQNSLNKTFIASNHYTWPSKQMKKPFFKKSSNYIILVTKGRYVIFEVPFCFGPNHRKICTTRRPLVSPNKNKKIRLYEIFQGCYNVNCKAKVCILTVFPGVVVLQLWS